MPTPWERYGGMNLPTGPPDPYRRTPRPPSQVYPAAQADPDLVTMRAPNGEVAQVPSKLVDLFRKNGAVLLGKQGWETPQPVAPLPPMSSRQVGQSIVPPPEWQGPVQPPQMRAATPEERTVGRLEEAGDPMNAFGARTQFGRTPNQPETPMAAMRPATMQERLGDRVDAVKTALMPAWMREEQARNPQVPEPFHTEIDPTMGTAEPEKLAAGAAEALVAKATAKTLKTKAVQQIEGGGFEKFKETGRRGFQFQPLDEAAKARLDTFKPGEKFSFAKLPSAARPKKIYDSIVAPGSNGYSVHPGTGQLVEGGKPGPRMVGIFPNSSNKTAVIPLSDFKPRDVEKFMLNNRAEFAKDNTLFVGGWQSKVDGVPHVFLDVVKPADTSRMATKIGELQNPGGKIRAGKVMPKQTTGIVRQPDGTWPKGQNAIFEPEHFDPSQGNYGEAPVGNHAEFVGSEDFQNRVKEMAGVGRVLMKDGNWWDIRGGPMEEVYGPDMMREVAGYTASTSPQNPPRPNLRMASELIRRHIKGEPVHDPNWRAPADAMGEGFSPGPGAAMPAPDTWKNNAMKVRAGQPETMFDDKVNDMFHAMIGKLVGVYDRHWAKLAEDPARGIYTDNVINKIQGSMKSGVLEAYPLIENAVRTAAKRAGVDVAKYSAWAWEGIRHTIKTTGELYGQKHPAHAIPEGNEGFNEIFAQLLGEKAAHLKISVPELKARLRSGDASLLTALLATPVGAAAYAKWHGSQQPNPADGPQ